MSDTVGPSKAIGSVHDEQSNGSESQADNPESIYAERASSGDCARMDDMKEDDKDKVAHTAEDGQVRESSGTAAAPLTPALDPVVTAADPLSCCEPEGRARQSDHSTGTARDADETGLESASRHAERLYPTPPSAVAAVSISNSEVHSASIQLAQSEAPAAAAGRSTPPAPPQHEEMHPIVEGLFHNLDRFFRWLSNDGRNAAAFNDLNMSDPYTGLAGGSQIKEEDESNSALVMSYERCMLGTNPNIIREDTTPTLAPEIVRGRIQDSNDAAQAV